MEVPKELKNQGESIKEWIILAHDTLLGHDWHSYNILSKYFQENGSYGA